MPEIRLTPSWRPWIVGLTPKSPAAVEAVCVPWPSSSRGETKESGATWLRPKPCRKKRAPMSLLLGQSAANVGSLPVSHVPFQPLLGGGAGGAGEGGVLAAIEEGGVGQGGGGARVDLARAGDRRARRREAGPAAGVAR